MTFEFEAVSKPPVTSETRREQWISSSRSSYNTLHTWVDMRGFCSPLRAQGLLQCLFGVLNCASAPLNPVKAPTCFLYHANTVLSYIMPHLGKGVRVSNTDDSYSV